MTFQELLINLLGTHGKWSINLEVDDWTGIIYVQSGKIVKAEVTGKESFSGKEALKFITSHEKEIKSVELLPLKNPVEKEINLNQMDVLSFFSNDLENTEAEETKKEEEASAFLKLCKNYFNPQNIKLIYTHHGFEYLNLEIEETFELEKEILSYYEIFKSWSSSKSIVFHFQKLFGIFLTEEEKFLFILLDKEELSNFELDEPEIVNNLRKLLRQENSTSSDINFQGWI